ncbi:Gfo/Idh/MocA family protein [Litchfieldia alkalitelluris]|uniref:Gfo/Idh/MocA family protein n=1 Tax=Litchfieldia alkalitelluris TaxID=304268 RepID=UPI000996313E|nr:Gfo/Idh/MocA family oxidoreductase [Litchfieldia alkalitelluris]
MRKIKAGIIGCGNISGIYFKAGNRFKDFEIIACADLELNRAQSKADEFRIKKAYTVEELLADPDVELVINLTIPQAHAEICLEALYSGKHVYVEKPLSISREDARQILDVAKEKGLLVGAAPDTFLGGGIQTCRNLLDEGVIGEVVAATAFMMIPGHERWHPDPAFYYQKGGGPMFDMGPYYLTALITLIGPIRRVSGTTRITYHNRMITSQPKHGESIHVETPTHIAGLIDFQNGAIGSIITSFDVWGTRLPHIEIYGSKGSLYVPDPNTFGGPVYVRKAGESSEVEVPLTHGYTDNSRGLGVADMANAMMTGKTHRANGEMAYHVLDVMQAFLDSSDQGSHIELSSSCKRPSPLPVGLVDGEVEIY